MQACALILASDILQGKQSMEASVIFGSSVPQEYYSQDNVVKIHIPVQFVLCLLMAAASQLSWKWNTGLQGLAGNPEKCLTTKGNCPTDGGEQG